MPKGMITACPYEGFIINSYIMMLVLGIQLPSDQLMRTVLRWN